MRFAQQVNATSLATGKYAWSMSLKAKYSDGSSSTRSFTGSSDVVNWNSNTEGDSNSNSTSYASVDADTDGQTDDLSTVTDPWGRVTTLVYSGGLLSTVTDHAGRVPL